MNKTVIKLIKTITYKNLHNFSFNKDGAIKFMANYYRGYDKDIKEYDLFVLENGKAAEFHPFMNNYDQIHNDWIELIHLPTKYKIIDIKKDVLKQYKDSHNVSYDVSYNIIKIIEI